MKIKPVLVQTANCSDDYKRCYDVFILGLATFITNVAVLTTNFIVVFNYASFSFRFGSCKEQQYLTRRLVNLKTLIIE